MKTRAEALAVAFLVLLTLILLVLTLATAATLPVTDCGDSGAPGQLRQVIAAAGAGDTVNIVACTIPLKAASPLTINKNLTITGAGAQRTILDGGNATRIFDITSVARTRATSTASTPTTACCSRGSRTPIPISGMGAR